MVNVLQECNAEVFLPQVFYHCAQLEFETLVRSVTDKDGNRWKPSRNDLIRYLKGHSALRLAAQKQFLSLDPYILGEVCPGLAPCISTDAGGVRLRIITKSLQLAVDCTFIFDPPWRTPKVLGNLCPACRVSVDSRYEVVCNETWNSLADIFDVSVDWPVTTEEVG